MGEEQDLKSPADALRLGIGMLHQDPHDFPSMTIREDLQIWDQRSGRANHSTVDWQALMKIQEDLGFNLDLDGSVGGIDCGRTPAA